MIFQGFFVLRKFRVTELRTLGLRSGRSGRLVQPENAKGAALSREGDEQRPQFLLDFDAKLNQKGTDPFWR